MSENLAVIIQKTALHSLFYGQGFLNDRCKSFAITPRGSKDFYQLTAEKCLEICDSYSAHIFLCFLIKIFRLQIRTPFAEAPKVKP
jgi:hypothetical protein